MKVFHLVFLLFFERKKKERKKRNHCPKRKKKKGKKEKILLMKQDHTIFRPDICETLPASKRYFRAVYLYAASGRQMIFLSRRNSVTAKMIYFCYAFSVMFRHFFKSFSVFLHDKITGFSKAVHDFSSLS